MAILDFKMAAILSQYFANHLATSLLAGKLISIKWEHFSNDNISGLRVCDSLYSLLDLEMYSVHWMKSTV